MTHVHRNPAAAARGFTLVELLIVISIIAMLAALVVGGLSVAQRRAEDAEAASDLSAIRQALSAYRLDEGQYPAYGREHDPERNDFPEVWRAFMDRPRPLLDNPGEEKVAVKDGDGYRPATRREVEDEEVDKYLLDPWGNPYVYRCNLGLKPVETMREKKKYDLYSLGRNQKDDTIFPDESSDGDDVYQ